MLRLPKTFKFDLTVYFLYVRTSHCPSFWFVSRTSGIVTMVQGSISLFECWLATIHMYMKVQPLQLQRRGRPFITLRSFWRFLTPSPRRSWSAALCIAFLKLKYTGERQEYKESMLNVNGRPRTRRRAGEQRSTWISHQPENCVSFVRTIGSACVLKRQSRVIESWSSNQKCVCFETTN